MLLSNIRWFLLAYGKCAIESSVRPAVMFLVLFTTNNDLGAGTTCVAGFKLIPHWDSLSTVVLKWLPDVFHSEKDNCISESIPSFCW